jgi:hypothetical protein
MTRLPVSLAAMAAVLLATPVAAQDTGPRVFTRSGSWSLDFGAESCQLARAFTNGSDQISLALERNRADNQVRMILVGNAVNPFRTADEIGYRYLPAADQRSARYIRSETSDGQGYFNFGTVFIGPNPFAAPPSADFAAPYNRAAELDYAAGITAIEFTEGLTQPIRLETGSLRGAVTVLQECMDDLLANWGLDKAQHQTMTRRAMPAGPAFEWLPSGIVGFGDFAAFGGAQNPFRVMVSAEGRPTSCTAHWVSLAARQNERICAGIMENGTFTPALDAAGAPMASYWMVDYMFGLSRPFPGR